MYDFTTRLDKKNTGSTKWENMYAINPNVPEGIVPLSMADMEFKNAPEIIEGIQDYLNDAVLGYANPTEGYYEALINWNKRRHNLEIKKEWVVNTLDVVTSMYAAIRAFSEPGDGVIIFRPIYSPFRVMIDLNDRKEINVPLTNTNDYYTIDFEGFEKEAKKEENKILLLCNPHNPIGRVWTYEELYKLAKICVENNIIIVSDEIWRDLVMPGYKYTPMQSLDLDLRKYLITCTSASKTFNIAGLKLSSIIIEDEELREKYKKEIAVSRNGIIGPIPYRGAEIAYNKCEKWLEELIQVLDTNQKLVNNYLKENCPEVTANLMEGTYVQWINFKALGLNPDELKIFMEEEALIFPDYGPKFGSEGNGYERINIALPTKLLEESLERMVKAIKRLNK